MSANPPGALRETSATSVNYSIIVKTILSVLARPLSTKGSRSPSHKSSVDYVPLHVVLCTPTSVLYPSPYHPTLQTGRVRTEECSDDAFVVQLTKLYRDISVLEADLEEVIHNLLEITLAPSVPAPLPNISTKYSIILRLWTDKHLESLRSASFTSVLALEHPQDFIPYTYTFYTGLLGEQILGMFRAGWLDAPGDLARYRMSVEAMVAAMRDLDQKLTTAAVSAVQSVALFHRRSHVEHVRKVKLDFRAGGSH